MAKKVKKWLKEHKTKVIIGTSATVLSVGAGLLYYKFGIKPEVDVDSIVEPVVDTVTYSVEKTVDDTVPIKLGIGTVRDLWKESDCINLIVNDITVADMGKLGECMQNVISDTTSETQVSAIIGLINPEEVVEVVEC